VLPGRNTAGSRTFAYNENQRWRKETSDDPISLFLGLPNSGANYEYLADSHLPLRIKFTQGASVIARTVREYEPNRPLLTSVRNKWGTATRSYYRYANDELGRREWVYRDGTAFAGDHADVWDYDARNELTRSLRYNTFDPNSPGKRTTRMCEFSRFLEHRDEGTGRMSSGDTAERMGSAEFESRSKPCMTR